MVGRMWAVTLLVACVAVQGQTIYNETQIRTWTYSCSACWNMKTDQHKYIEINSNLPFGYDQVVAAEVNVRAKNGNTFNLTRQGGFRTGGGTAANKSGGNATFYRSSPGYPANLYVHLDRGDCPRSSSESVNCTDNQPPEKNSYDNFFVRNAQFPVGGLDFTAAGVVIRIDYVCGSANCNSEALTPTPTYVQWKEIGTWNMVTRASKVFSPSNFGGANILNNLVEMSATIHSDPFNDPAYPTTSNTIQVDNLEHLGSRAGNMFPTKVKTPYLRARGGILWYGLGCYHWRPSALGSGQCPDKSQPTGHDYLKLWAGPGSSTGAGGGSSYRSGLYFDYDIEHGRTIPYTGTQNRGWIKLRSFASVGDRNTHYVRRAVVPIYGWNPYAAPTRKLDLTAFGAIRPDRITRLETLIGSDNLGSLPHVNVPGNSFTNFHRTATTSGTGIGSDGDEYNYVSGEHGGLTYVDQAQGKVVLSLGYLVPDHTNYFKSPNYNHWQIRHENTNSGFRRGFVSLEYLGAKCGEGSGYTRSVIGFTGNTDDCHGNFGSGSSSSHVIQTKGQNIDGTNSIDRFYFAHKGFTNSNAAYAARVAQMENTGSSAKAGVMLRLGTANNNRHISVLVTPSGGVQMLRRASEGGFASVTTVPNVKAPVWVRVRRYLDNYYGEYSQNGVNWTQIGQSMYIPNYTGTYRAGLAVASGSSTALNTTGFTDLNF